MKRQHKNPKTSKLAFCNKVWLLLPVFFLMPMIPQAANWPNGHLSVTATYHIYSTGSGYQYTVYNGSTLIGTYDGLGYLIVSGGATVNFIFHTSKSVGVSGGLKIDSGTLNMSLADDYSVPVGQPTLVRWTAQSLFQVTSNTDNINNGNLSITGSSTKQFIIDGGANITYSGSNEAGWTATNTSTVAKDPLVLLQGGNATLEYVDLRNNWFCYNNIGEGAAIFVTTKDYLDHAFDGGVNEGTTWSCNTHCNLVVKHTNISYCVSERWGTAITLQCPLKNGNTSSARFEDCTIEYCYNFGHGSGPGGVIRGLADSRCSLSMTRCTVSHNMSQHIGGGVWWESAMASAMQLTNCWIDDNYSSNNGGGMYLVSSKAVLTGCKIRNNYSGINGGGLVYCNFGGPATGYLPTNYTPSSASLTLDANTEITGNHADGAGGGMYIDVSPMNLAYGYGETPAATAWCVFYDGTTQQQYKINIDLNGGTISNNTAGGNGGGIYLQRNTDIYQTNVRLNWGKLENNTAGDYGGGCFIQSIVTSINYYLNSSYSSLGYNGVNPFVNIADDIKMDVTFGSSSASGNLSVVGNVAKAGGAMFVNVNHDMSVTNSVIYTKVYGNSTIGNAAHPNVANNAEGGAIFVNGGEIHLYGGSITNNTAIGNGGGIYPGGSSIVKVGAGDFEVQHNTVNGAPNNLYMPTGKTIEVVSGSFDPEYLGIYTQATATVGNSIPVFTVSTAANYTYLNTIYNGMRNGTMNVIDDRQIHSAEYTSPQTTLYFGIGSPWSPYQQTVRKSTDLVDSNGDGVFEIGSIKQLTAFLWYANGITTHDATFTPAVPGAKGILTADINMENHYWEPFANYSGIFDGNGHVITGITMVPTNASAGRGLFGTTAAGADIKNVTLDDCQFFAPSSGTCYVGSIVSDLSAGKVSNSVSNPGTQLFASGNASAILGGIAGRMSGGTLHSSIAMTEMTGYTMGGLVGQVSSGNLYNSFANPKFNYSGTSNQSFVGGIVGESTGTVANCYVRFSRTQSLTGAKFGQLAGSISSGGSVANCYSPETFTSDVPSTIVHTGSATASYTYKVADAPYLYNRPNDNLVGDTPMFKKLNEWVSSQINTIADLAYWKRSTAGGYSYTYNEVTYTGGNINDDYPLLKMQGLCCAASSDGLSIEYKKSLDDMIDKYNGLSGGGTIWLYASPKEDDGSDEKVGETNDSDVLLYIDEDASLLQSTSAKGTLTAYASQTIPGDPRSWHFLSSSLTNSGIGFNYGQDATFNWDPNPCHVTISGNDDASLFPSDLPSSGGYADVSKIDLYAFYEPEYHWINLKRNSDSHWHMNATTLPITYTNETTLTPGKGYLVSVDQDQLLQNKGTLNNDDEVEIALGYTPANAWTGLLGYNLIGNPYQSYLNFSAFVRQNSALWYDDSKGKSMEPTYAVYDAEKGGYIQYKAGASRGSRTASGTLNMHQGFMVRSSVATRAKFTNAMRTNEGNGVSFRGEQPAYPLINLTVTDDEGVNDFAVLELGRYRDEGAEKLRANDSKGWLYLHHGSEDYGILFRTEVDDYQPLWFEADEAGSYTLSWETANAEFEALTLIDNITGVVTDMLAHDRYNFEATPEQYASRFKIVVGDYKDIEENEAPEPVEGPTFAYVNNGNIVLTGLETEGEASLQVIDMTGRVILCRDASHASAISTDGIAAGVYILRLTDGKGSKIQKIVLE